MSDAMAGRNSAAPVVLVTGAGSGMGMETALHLAERGYRVYGSIRSEDEREALLDASKSRGVSLDILSIDVTQAEQVRAAISGMVAASGRIDALVQFVGIGLRGFFEDL